MGAGPGVTVGSALALKGSGRLPIGVLGDGDFLMGNTALWTATHYQIPCLIVVCNNRSFFNDELHQERVAKERGRPVENRWIGMRIGDPDIDIAAMARSMRAVGIGPVAKPGDLLLFPLTERNDYGADALDSVYLCQFRRQDFIGFLRQDPEFWDHVHEGRQFPRIERHLAEGASTRIRSNMGNPA